jgi:G3E family GTPase
MLPVTVVTGFLGSGKSTLLNRMLVAPELASAAVIINEFGDVAIDHLLVQKAVDNAVVLASGCICCTIRGDLVDTLLDLEARAKRGEIPNFDRVVIETTGLADAAPVMQTLLSDFSLAGRYEVTDVITTVDAVNAFVQVARFPEAKRQIAFADTIVLTKRDLVDAAQAEAVSAMVGEINPYAEVIEGGGAIPAIGKARNPLGRTDVIAEPTSHGAGGIRSTALIVREPIDPGRLKRWLLSITSLRGRSILRLKGIVNVAGINRPVVVQGVHHMLYPPAVLAEWPNGGRQSRIVCITDGLKPGAIEATLPFLTEKLLSRGG